MAFKKKKTKANSFDIVLYFDQTTHVHSIQVEALKELDKLSQTLAFIS